jgi:hypothetical protein
VDVSGAPIDPRSSAFIDFINAYSVPWVHPDLGGEVWPGSVEVFGMPYLVVDGSQPKQKVRFEYANESDGVDHTTMESYPFYPIPDAAIANAHLIEGGWSGKVDRRGDNDRHLLIFDAANNHLYELFGVFFDENRWEWHATSGAFFDLNSTARRTVGWTSADAAGMAILPLLIEYDEVFRPDEIDHAFRVTMRATNGYVYPASHFTDFGNSGALPLGARLRLKAQTDLSSFPPEAQKIFRAMKKYGLIVADNGGDMYVGGTFDMRWNNNVLNPAFFSLNASNFEVVQLGYGAP